MLAGCNVKDGLCLCVFQVASDVLTLKMWLGEQKGTVETI